MRLITYKDINLFLMRFIKKLQELSLYFQINYVQLTHNDKVIQMDNTINLKPIMANFLITK